MEFRIADTFTASLAKLTGDEQKAVKTTAFDLQLDPANPGMQFHRLGKVKDPNFWSVRANQDIRLIVHKTDASLLLCYVDHHDKAYAWAERRKLQTHPKTGAAQLVEIRERVQEITVPKYVEEVVAQPAKQALPKSPLYDTLSVDELLAFGVPEEWIEDVQAANEDTVFELLDHLPAEAGEALLTIATGGQPQKAEVAAAGSDPFEHPDAQRRFRVMTNVEELQQALDAPWEKWTVFLHPAQRKLVQRNYNGPARVSGSAGTGKTIVALHRAVYLARKHPKARILVTTFSESLAQLLRQKLFLLSGQSTDTLSVITVASTQSLAAELHQLAGGKVTLVDDDRVRLQLRGLLKGRELSFSEHFVWTEWRDVVDAWQINTWEDYRDVKRMGRKSRLGESQRELLWAVFSDLRDRLQDAGEMTLPMMLAAITEASQERESPFDFVVIDEAQDVSVAELRFFAGITKRDANGLFFAGDLGQRIFQTPFSWKSLGVDVRGRSHTLRINYRTSHQIRRSADRLLPTDLADADGNSEDRRGTISVFDGPEPKIQTFDDTGSEATFVAEWLQTRMGEGYQPGEVGVFVRSDAELARASKAIELAALPSLALSGDMKTTMDAVAVGTMHLAKGLEFRAVAVMGCNDEIIPLASRMEDVSDDAELEDVYNTERHLFYVACTRARDLLLLTGVEPASEYLDDIGKG